MGSGAIDPNPRVIPLTAGIHSVTFLTDFSIPESLCFFGGGGGILLGTQGGKKWKEQFSH